MFSAISLLIKNEGTEYWGYFRACALAVHPLDIFAVLQQPWKIFLLNSPLPAVSTGKQVLIYLLR